MYAVFIATAAVGIASFALSRTDLAQRIGDALGFAGCPEWAKK